MKMKEIGREGSAPLDPPTHTQTFTYSSYAYGTETDFLILIMKVVTCEN